MGALRDRMVQDLKLRCYSPATVDAYISKASRFVAFAGKSPTAMGAAEVRTFMLHLIEARKLEPATVRGYLASISFLFTTTLQRPEVVIGIPWPHDRSKKLPDILSREEVEQLLEAVAGARYRLILMAAYGAGLRITEACSLKTTDIDAARGVIHVRDGKGRRDRYVMLSLRLLAALREYWRSVRPPGPYLFPGQNRDFVSPKTVSSALRRAKAKVGILKRITTHSLRHAFATHLLEGGEDIRVIQMLLGHSSIQTTTRYAHVTPAHVQRIPSPLDSNEGGKRDGR